MALPANGALTILDINNSPHPAAIGSHILMTDSTATNGFTLGTTSFIYTSSANYSGTDSFQFTTTMALLMVPWLQSI